MILPFFSGFSQTNLPFKEWNSVNLNPYVLYISGDGGFNEFSTGLCNAIHRRGYSVAAVNAKSYFWNKKTPEKTTADITSTLEKKFVNRKNQQLILVGYSFGADVMPFIVNRLPGEIKNKLLSVILLSPSTSTDFEVHWTDMFSSNRKRSMDVIAEMNKMEQLKTITIIGVNENHFPIEEIRLKNYTNEILPGGHDFDGNSEEVAKTLIKYFK
ncbi:MAG: AcvB/VirJ family lysyl-phosphatidylglycerol hydrolase [Flavitalea sp.]